MAILRSRNQQGNVVKVANPAVDRSILAWEQRITDAESSAYERAKEDLRQEYEQRLQKAEQAVANAEQRIADGVAQAEAEMQQRWQAAFKVWPIVPKKSQPCAPKAYAAARENACV